MPEICVKTYEMFVLPDNLEALFEEKPDYVIDAIDTVTAKPGAGGTGAETGYPGH